MALASIAPKPVNTAAGIELLRWASGGTVLEPSSAQQTLGWQAQNVAGPPDYRIANYREVKEYGWLQRLQAACLFAERSQARYTVPVGPTPTQTWTMTLDGNVTGIHTIPAAATQATEATARAALLNADAVLRPLMTAEAIGNDVMITWADAGHVFTVAFGGTAPAMTTVYAPTTPSVVLDSTSVGLALSLDVLKSAIGNGAVAAVATAHARGNGALASFARSFSDGHDAQALAVDAHAHGTSSRANAADAHAYGSGAIADLATSWAGGYAAAARALASTALGYGALVTAGATQGMALGTGQVGASGTFGLASAAANVNAAYARAHGNTYTTAAHDHSDARGNGALTMNQGEMAWAGGAFGTGAGATQPGASQAGSLDIRVRTTNTGNTPMTPSGGGALSWTLKDNTAYEAVIRVVARDEATGDRATWEFKVSVACQAGAAVLDYSTVFDGLTNAWAAPGTGAAGDNLRVFGNGTLAAPAGDCNLGVSGASIIVNANGVNPVNVRWTARIDWVQVGQAA